MALAATPIRELVLAANRRIAGVKRADRVAAVVITLGGVGIVASVLGMLLFVGSEAWPLFRPAQGRSASVTAPARFAGAAAAVPDRPLAVGVDEYQMFTYAVRTDGRIAFARNADASLAREVPIPGIDGATITATSRSLQGDFVGVGTSDGRVALVQVRFRPKYEQQRLSDLEIEVKERGQVQLDPQRRPIRELSYREESGAKAVAGVVAADEIAVWSSDESGTESRVTLKSLGGDAFTRVRLGRTDTVIAGTEVGNVYLWDLTSEPRHTEMRSVSLRPITALEWALGDVTFIVGDSDGAVSAWFRARLQEDDEQRPLVRAHAFASQRSAIRAIGASSRDKSFVTAGADGSLVLRHLTSERTLVSLKGSGPVDQVVVTPKADALLALQTDGAVARYDIVNPHPEVSVKMLLGKVWYEGYSQPGYVWQSTGGTNDFETKFSLVPLIFGTIKGTIYALLFAVPLAVMGALYTSQFMHPSLRNTVKPIVEIMAALPSVVIGFVAGLWLASRVERNLVPVLLMTVLLPAVGTAGVLLWGLLPSAVARKLKPGTEVVLILPLLLLGGWLAAGVSPALESRLFDGSFQLWLKSALDLTYDQRNCLVVGLAMGFAVIPIIFTISEDAFSSVPSNLGAASLALGASRWQTAVRVVLPTASPGVFSAMMIGFGRAVGETMIVLMATGNTPVLDWSIFNGMRTLSANIAVEIPEAPHGGTLYRVLFLAAALLFLMTFIANTVAEVIRQRLRERYRAL